MAVIKPGYDPVLSAIVQDASDARVPRGAGGSGTGLKRAGMAHHLAIRVYYEDTDLAGIVYYANYLKFIERGRSGFFRALGIDQTALKADHGIVFAVSSRCAGSRPITCALRDSTMN